ncbi:hypothetical protein B0H14DRAFT_1520869 [Mycena olivaceomarginata]|nr:hypothetical protein B0H14DRAFT_1520869 [Mycena olivaceomarginata]
MQEESELLSRPPMFSASTCISLALIVLSVPALCAPANVPIAAGDIPTSRPPVPSPPTAGAEIPTSRPPVPSPPTAGVDIPTSRPPVPSPPTADGEIPTSRPPRRHRTVAAYGWMSWTSVTIVM